MNIFTAASIALYTVDSAIFHFDEFNTITTFLFVSHIIICILYYYSYSSYIKDKFCHLTLSMFKQSQYHNWRTSYKMFFLQVVYTLVLMEIISCAIYDKYLNEQLKDITSRKRHQYNSRDLKQWFAPHKSSLNNRQSRC